MNRIFVTYRVGDCEGMAVRIVEGLQSFFGADAVLHEIAPAPLGANIRKHVLAAMNSCTALVVVIGTRWLRAEAQNHSTLFDPWDLQRVAIESALAAGMPVVPVFVDKDARNLDGELPATLVELVFRSGVILDESADFAAQVEALARGLEDFVSPPKQQKEESRPENLSPRLEELRQAEREIRQKTRSILLAGAGHAKPKGLHTLRDIPIAPEMVIIPAGHFIMGSPQGEAERRDNEGPQHEVVIRRFACGKYAVTFDEYDAFARAMGAELPDDEGWGRGRRPVINVSWEDAQAYVQWLNEMARDELEGQSYRLLTEAEWEYACRAGTTTPFYTGEMISTDQANFDGNFVYGENGKGRSLKATVEVGSYPPNPWGLYDMLGNTWEWVGDRYHENYKGAPGNGTTWESGKSPNRILRGGSWDSIPASVRAAARNFSPQDNRCGFDGFRIARTL